MSKRAVLTGASRQLGFHIAQAALEAGFEVELLIKVRNTNIDRLLSAGAHFTVVDFDERATYRRHLEWADVFFHGELAETIESSERVLNMAVAAGVPRIVYTSSADVLGCNRDSNRLLSETDRTREEDEIGNSVEAMHDQICDRLIRDHGVDLRRLYPSWLLGSGDTRGSLPQKLIRSYLKNGQNYWCKGGVSIASVEEAARAHVSAALADPRCGVYVLGGENISLRQLYSQLAELSGRPAPTFQIPTTFLRAMPGRAASTTLGNLAGAYYWYDSSKAVRELDYKIRPAKDVLKAGILMERKRAAGTNALFYRAGARQIPRTASDAWSNSPILLTGAPGWLANRFIDVLLNGDRTGFKYPQRKVHLLVQPHQHMLFDLPANFQIFTADLTRPCDLSQALAGVQTVFHLQSATSPRRIETLYRVNTEGTKNLADECIRAGVRRVLYVSTDAVCSGAPQSVFDEATQPVPLDAFGRSKWLAEEYLLEQFRAGLLDLTILREFWTFGPFAPARHERYLASLRRSRQLVFGDGKRLRSVSHIDNTISALLAAERAPKTFGKAYWIGDAKHDYTVDEINALLCEAMGLSYRPFYLPQQTSFAAHIADRALSMLGRLHPGLQTLASLDRDRAGRIDAAHRDFGYCPLISFPDYVKDLAKRGRPEPASRKASAG